MSIREVEVSPKEKKAAEKSHAWVQELSKEEQGHQGKEWTIKEILHCQAHKQNKE